MYFITFTLIYSLWKMRLKQCTYNDFREGQLQRYMVTLKAHRFQRELGLTCQIDLSTTGNYQYEVECTEENSDLDHITFTRTQYLLDCQDLWRTRHEEHSDVLLQLKISSAPPCLSSIHYLHQGNSLSIDEQQNNLYFSFTIFLNYFCQQICLTMSALM